MNNLLKNLISLFALLTISAYSAYGQVNVTFNLNLKPQIEDSIFVPGIDRVHIKGNLYPLGMNQSIELHDTAPKDSIYTVEVKFSSSQNGKSLQYNFLMRTEAGDIQEDQPRVISLREENQVLDAIYFNSFAW